MGVCLYMYIFIYTHTYIIFKIHLPKVCGCVVCVCVCVLLSERIHNSLVPLLSARLQSGKFQQNISVSLAIINLLRSENMFRKNNH